VNQLKNPQALPIFYKTIQFDDFSYKIKWQRMLQAGGTLMYGVMLRELGDWPLLIGFSLLYA
jgi:hypothetical protein